jgi:hypothetical protein
MRSFFSTLSAWDWLDLFGLLMVLLGVIGEFWSAGKHNPFCERIWGYVLILGLALELIALPNHFIEAGKLKQLAERANERATITESNNLVLRSNVVALELKLQPRVITPAQMTNFESLTKLITKSLPIKISIGSTAQAGLARQFREMLDRSGFKRHQGETEPWGFSIDNIAIGRLIGEPTEPRPFIYLIYGTNVPKTYSWYRDAKTGFSVTVTNQMHIYGTIIQVLKEIEIPTGTMRSEMMVKPDECEFFIPARED